MITQSRLLKNSFTGVLINFITTLFLGVFYCSALLLKNFSRIPIFKDRADNITGFVLKDEMLEAIINKKGKETLATLKREILVTRRNKPIPELFDKFVEQRDHISLVVDEYGSVSGLVTMEDVIETLLGLEIMDESDNVEDLQVLARKNWEVRAKRLGIIEEENEIE